MLKKVQMIVLLMLKSDWFDLRSYQRHGCKGLSKINSDWSIKNFNRILVKRQNPIGCWQF